MSCQHNNPTFHRYCVTCGSNLQRVDCPRCGAVCDNKHLFCHACGESMHQPQHNDTPTVMLAQTYDLDAMLQNTPQNSAVKIEKSAGKMTQDEIKKLLAAKQKKS